MDKNRKKTGGRTTGTPNKVTSELRTRIQDFINDNFKYIESDFEKLDPRDRANLIIKLMEYVLPKQRQIEDTTLGQLFAMTPEQREQRIKELQNNLGNE